MKKKDVPCQHRAAKPFLFFYSDEKNWKYTIFGIQIWESKFVEINKN